MNKITRAELRGKHLDDDCHKAKTKTKEFGSTDNRVFCLGLGKDKCIECKAYIRHARPL